jgi:hypothetical protein
MIKTTQKELKREARFTERKQLVEYLQSESLKIVKVEKVAYCVSQLRMRWLFIKIHTKQRRKRHSVHWSQFVDVRMRKYKRTRRSALRITNIKK